MDNLIKVLDGDNGRRYFFFENHDRVSILFDYESSTGKWTLINPSISDEILACGVFKCDGEKFLLGRRSGDLPHVVFLSFLCYFKRDADKARDFVKFFSLNKK